MESFKYNNPAALEEMAALEDARFFAYLDKAFTELEEHERIRCEEMHDQGLCLGICIPYAYRVHTPKTVQLKEEEAE